MDCHFYESTVYVLTYIPTGKKYVGRSTSVNNRFKSHLLNLTRGKHNNKQLQEDYNRFGGGADAFKVETVGTYRFRPSNFVQNLEFQTMVNLKTYDERYGYNSHDPMMQKIREKNHLPRTIEVKKEKVKKMDKYMVVCFTLVPHSTWSKFFNDKNQAEDYMTNAECGLGAIVELYKRTDDGYELLSR